MSITIASDVILVNDKDEILLVRRSPTSNAYPNFWALPGGKMEINETTMQCAIRELKEETGYDILIPFPKSARIFDRVDRDPRGRTISVVFYGIIFKGSLNAGDDASDAAWFPRSFIHDGMILAFDHNKIINEMM
jgi:8-oxo-dGTP diphosphatase